MRTVSQIVYTHTHTHRPRTFIEHEIRFHSRSLGGPNKLTRSRRLDVISHPLNRISFHLKCAGRAIIYKTIFEACACSAVPRKKAKLAQRDCGVESRTRPHVSHRRASCVDMSSSSSSCVAFCCLAYFFVQWNSDLHSRDAQIAAARAQQQRTCVHEMLSACAHARARAILVSTAHKI